MTRAYPRSIPSIRLLEADSRRQCGFTRMMLGDDGSELVSPCGAKSLSADRGVAVIDLEAPGKTGTQAEDGGQQPG